MDSSVQSEGTFAVGFSAEQIRDLGAKIDAALTSGRLDAWQTGFLSDMKDRFAKYGSKTRLSERQVSKLYEIIGGPRPAGKGRPRLHDAAGSRRLSRRPRPFRKQRPGRSGLAREFRWLKKRFVFGAAIAAAFVLGVGAYFAIQEGSLSVTGYLGSAKAIVGHQFTITDGDTVKILGERKGTRLVGFNTPETYRPRCERELTLGKRATQRLREIVATSSIELERVACACRPGTEGTDACNFGRSCGILRADGRNVGEILISEGLAVRFSCGPTSCPPMPRPWCG